jgi:hypothetical protein
MFSVAAESTTIVLPSRPGERYLLGIFPVSPHYVEKQTFTITLLLSCTMYHVHLR